MHKSALSIRFEVMFDRTKRATDTMMNASCVKAHRKFFFLQFKRVARIFESKSQIDSSTATYDTSGFAAVPASQSCTSLKREIKSGRINGRHVYPVNSYKRESRIRSARSASFAFIYGSPACTANALI